MFVGNSASKKNTFSYHTSFLVAIFLSICRNRTGIIFSAVVFALAQTSAVHYQCSENVSILLLGLQLNETRVNITLLWLMHINKMVVQRQNLHVTTSVQVCAVES